VVRQSIRRGNAAWRDGVEQAWAALSAIEQPLTAQTRRNWKALNTRFHDALIAAGASAWTFRVLRLLSRHGERYRRHAIALPGSTRDVHAEHPLIVEMALSGQDAPAALVLEAHIRATPDQLLQAHRHRFVWGRCDR
jgi:DNA-binding GntR family transcriptional regulator